MEKRIITPLNNANELRAGEMVLISGSLFTARDQAHKRLVECLERGEDLPVSPGEIIFYAGPSQTPPGRVIGAIGPTTSVRMDAYAPRLMAAGLKYMLGKGNRSAEVVKAAKEFGGVYFVTVGGAAAYLAKRVSSMKLIAFEDLGTEAIRELKVEDFPAIVAIDTMGNYI